MNINREITGTVIIKAVGDICPGDKTIMGLGLCSLMKKHGIGFPLINIKELLKGDSLVVGNLEGILSSIVTCDDKRQYTFCGMPAFAQELKASGFTVMNVANNHTLEHGAELFQETVHHCQEAGISVCGLRDKGTYYSKPVIVERGGRRIGFLGYNWVGKDKFLHTDRYIAQSHDSVVNYTWNRDSAKDKRLQDMVGDMNINVRRDIHHLRQCVDYVILLAHWGFEFIHYPPYGVTIEARSFIDAGADLILGGHPHVLQGMEVYKGKQIFYSLGNFLFDMRLRIAKRSAVVHVEIDDRNQASWSLEPIIINNAFQPTPARGAEDREIRILFGKANEMLNVHDARTALDDDKVYREFEQYYNRAKLLGIVHHFQALLQDSKVMVVIAKKFLGLLNLVRNRLRGNKVRW
jgi:poly-gamma-glutamate capsule biosynthesis protein CapA/YwtB (metallophosphatase superfamily)